MLYVQLHYYVSRFLPPIVLQVLFNGNAFHLKVVNVDEP